MTTLVKLGIKETSRYDRGKTTQGKKTKIVVANDPEDRKGALKSIGGSQSDHWNNTLSNQAVQALWLKHSDFERVRPAAGRHRRRAHRHRPKG